MALTNTPTKEMSYLTIGSNTYEIVDATARSQSGSGTVTSVGVSNDTNGGLSVSGSPVTTSGTITIGHSNVLTSAQTTSGVYPIKIDKNGHISAYGTAVSIPTQASDIGAAPSSHNHGNITSGGDITATAPTIANGDQLVINDSSASKITNGPTFDGSTTTKALSQKGTWETFLCPTIATDDYLTIIDRYADNEYITLSTNSDLDTGEIKIEKNKISLLVSSQDAGGTHNNSLNVTPTGTTIKNLVTPTTNDMAASKGYVDGLVPTITLNGSSTTSPNFYAPTSVGTSNYYLKSSGSGAPSWQAPSDSTSNSAISTGTALVTERDVYYGLVTVNGSSQTRATGIYAPTSAGTSGYYLKSNGTGAPSWTSFPTIPSITLNGSSTTSPSFYAPTSAGTSGYYLKSNGSGAPEWAAISTGGVTDVTVAGTSVVTSGVAVIAAPVQIVRW